MQWLLLPLWDIEVKRWGNHWDYLSKQIVCGRSFDPPGGGVLEGSRELMFV